MIEKVPNPHMRSAPVVQSEHTRTPHSKLPHHPPVSIAGPRPQLVHHHQIRPEILSQPEMVPGPEFMVRPELMRSMERGQMQHLAHAQPSGHGQNRVRATAPPQTTQHQKDQLSPHGKIFVVCSVCIVTECS